MKKTWFGVNLRDYFAGENDFSGFTLKWFTILNFSLIMVSYFK